MCQVGSCLSIPFDGEVVAQGVCSYIRSGLSQATREGCFQFIHILPFKPTERTTTAFHRQHPCRYRPGRS